jgi:hypothetical protein
MNLEAIYEEMNLNITKHFVFYITENEITKRLISPDYLSQYNKTVFYCNGNLEIIEYPDTNPIEFISKAKALQSNYFRLLELKNQMTPDTFKLWYQTYLKQIDGFASLAELVKSNIQKDIPDCKEEILGYVIYNSLVLNEHLDSIKAIEPELNQVEMKKEDFYTSLIENQPFKGIKKDLVDRDSNNEIKQFRDFIKHDQKIEIEHIIKTHYSDLKGVSLRYLIEFLVEKQLILLTHGVKKEVYRSLMLLFNNKIGSYSSIFDTKIVRDKDLKYIKSRDNFLSTLKEFT